MGECSGESDWDDCSRLGGDLPRDKRQVGFATKDKTVTRLDGNAQGRRRGSSDPNLLGGADMRAFFRRGTLIRVNGLSIVFVTGQFEWLGKCEG